MNVIRFSLTHPFTYLSVYNDFNHVIILYYVHEDDIDDDHDIQNMRKNILNAARKACIEAHNYMKTFAKYEHIWSDDENTYRSIYPVPTNENSVESLSKYDYIDDITGDNVHANDATCSFQIQVSVFFLLF